MTGDPDRPVPDDTRDVVALWRLQSAYADVVTRRAWDELHGLFLPTTTVEVDTVTSPVRTFTGPADFGAFVAAAIERYDHFAFVILNTVVDVDPGGDDGSGRIFMCEIRHDAVSDDWHTAYGLYQDRYRRQDGRWWFSTRHYRSLARTGPTPAVLGLPPTLPPIPPTGL
jgi:SnoaL-like domain